MAVKQDVKQTSVNLKMTTETPALSAGGLSGFSGEELSTIPLLA